MYKKTITYTDFNGVERTEDFYFHLSKAELMEMETTSKQGLSNYMQSIVKGQNGSEILRVVKEIILKAYGEKSPDGRYFDKSEVISNRFFNSPAYDVLFLDLTIGDDAAKKSAEFFNGLIPKDLEDIIKNESNKN